MKCDNMWAPTPLAVFFQTPSNYFIADAVGWNLPLDHFFEGFQSTINISHLCITTNQGIEGSDVRLKTMSFQLSHPVLESVGTHIASFRIWFRGAWWREGENFTSYPGETNQKTRVSKSCEVIMARKKKGFIGSFLHLPKFTCFLWLFTDPAAINKNMTPTNLNQSQNPWHWIESCPPKHECLQAWTWTSQLWGLSRLPDSRPFPRGIFCESNTTGRNQMTRKSTFSTFPNKNSNFKASALPIFFMREFQVNKRKICWITIGCHAEKSPKAWRVNTVYSSCGGCFFIAYGISVHWASKSTTTWLIISSIKKYGSHHNSGCWKILPCLKLR